MNNKRISKWILISGTLIIWSIKYAIRPYCECKEPMIFFLGIAPNLIGSFLLPFGAYWFFTGKDFMLARIFRIQSLNDLRNFCIMGFGILVVNEYLQLIPYFGRTFDYFDILFSIIGLTFSYFIFSRIFNRSLYSYYPD